MMHLHLTTIHAMPSPQAVPLAAASLKAYLDARLDPSHPVNVSCSEFYSGSSPETMVATILELGPDIVGFPLYLWNRLECCTVAGMLRDAAPGMKLIAGGPEATADPVGVLSECAFDFLVVGEGELTLAEVLDRLASGSDLDNVAGIARIKDGEAVVSRRSPVEDLGILASPWLAGILDDHIGSGVVWQLSRGCSFGCDFCFDGMGDRKVRRYPMARLEAELRYVVSRGVSQIFVLDSTFNQDVRRAKAILRLIGSHAPDVHCHFEIRHEMLDAEQADLFAALTCSLQLGLQSADPEVAQNVGRKFSRQEFAGKIMMLNEAGAIFGFDLIYGLPGDTLAHFRDGVDFALSLYPNHLDIFPLSVLPGTKVAVRSTEYGFRYLSRPPYTLIGSSSFPENDMLSARRLAAACDIFYSRGKAVAWFNGIVAALKLSPVSFLDLFARWLLEKTGQEPEETDYKDEEIWQLQRAFLDIIFTRKKQQRLLPLALDFVDYHYYYAASLMAVPPRMPTGPDLDNTDLLNVKLVKAESARLAIFSYEILDLLEAGEPDLKEFAAAFEPVGSFALIYPRKGEVIAESLAEPYYRLLERLDGQLPASGIAAELSIPAEDAMEFLHLAVSEGVAVYVGDVSDSI